jgi:hypothetical protein
MEGHDLAVDIGFQQLFAPDIFEGISHLLHSPTTLLAALSGAARRFNREGKSKRASLPRNNHFPPDSSRRRGCGPILQTGESQAEAGAYLEQRLVLLLMLKLRLRYGASSAGKMEVRPARLQGHVEAKTTRLSEVGRHRIGG